MAPHTRQRPETGSGDGNPPSPGHDWDPETGTWKVYYDPQCPWCEKAREFRRALAHLTNKNEYCTDILKGYGYQIETMVPYPALIQWTDYSSLEGLICDYNVNEAELILNEAGFTLNPHTQTRRDPRTGSTLAPLIFVAPIETEEQSLQAAAELLMGQMEDVGIPVNRVWRTTEFLFDQVACDYNYHIAATGFSGSACEDIYFIDNLYHSRFYWGPIDYSPNFVGFCNLAFDEEAEQIRYGMSREDVRQAAIEAQVIYANQTPVIDLWCLAGVKAYRTGWEGAVNMEGMGVDNYFGFMNMYQSGKETIRWGVSYNIPSLHIVCSITIDKKILDLIYESLIVPDPYNLQEDCGLLAESWSTGTWTGGSTVTFTLRDGVKWHDGTDLTPEDVKFSIMFNKACEAWSGYNCLVADVDHVNIKADEPSLATNQVKVYFSTSSYWAPHWAGYVPIINKNIWMAANTKYGWGYGTGSWNPSKVYQYQPWEEDGNNNGKVDLKEDGTGPWKFVSKGSDSLLLEANRDFYRTQEQISGCIETAFHKIGNVNYDGAYYEDEYAGIDREISMIDLNLLSKASGTDESWPWGIGWDQYNPDADLNSDGCVDALDLAIMGSHYGKVAG